MKWRAANTHARQNSRFGNSYGGSSESVPRALASSCTSKVYEFSARTVARHGPTHPFTESRPSVGRRLASGTWGCIFTCAGPAEPDNVTPASYPQPRKDDRKRTREAEWPSKEATRSDLTVSKDHNSGLEESTLQNIQTMDMITIVMGSREGVQKRRESTLTSSLRSSPRV